MKSPGCVQDEVWAGVQDEISGPGYRTKSLSRGTGRNLWAGVQSLSRGTGRSLRAVYRTKSLGRSTGQSL